MKNPWKLVGLMFATGLVLIAAGLLGKHFENRCDPYPWRAEFRYGTYVQVTDGFYMGCDAVIDSQAWSYNPDTCNQAAYKVFVRNRAFPSWQVVQINQAALKVIK